MRAYCVDVIPIQTDRTERWCDSASVDLATVKMDFHFDDWFPKETNVGCETSIYDVMIGDPTLFMRADVVGQGWRIMQPVRLGSREG
jgi:glucose-6-phosphate 1-dehydrogenase